MRKSGFTLIELLVVIAIIAILAAILFPVFAQARAKARQTSCLSNLKQLNMGMVMYAQDFDESFPQWQWDLHWAGGAPNNAGGQGNGVTIWFNAIFPYVKNSQIYTCPDTNYNPVLTNNNGGSWGWFNFPALGNVGNTGIAPQLANTRMSYGASEPLTYSLPNLASWGRPAETLLIADCITGLSGWDGWDQGLPTDPRSNSVRIRRVAYPNGSGQGFFWTDPAFLGPFNPQWERFGRHSNGNNIGFVDGHVKYFPTTRTTGILFGRE